MGGRRTSVQIEKPVAATAAPATTFARTPSLLLQRRCACGGDKSADCDECNSKKLSRRAADNSVSPHAVPPIVNEVLNAPGRPLDDATRAFMEPRFGHDFSRVRVHADKRAAESSSSVNALAYTVGSDIVFGEGRYRPGTDEGRRLLAHELTHTIQQASGIARVVMRQEETGAGDADGGEEEARASKAADGDTGLDTDGGDEGLALKGGRTARASVRKVRAPAGTTGYSKTEKARYVVYENEVRVGGTKQWRNNNPGAITYSQRAKELGAIGKDKNEFSVFPDRVTGRAAIPLLLRGGKYKNKTITETMNIYAPEKENNTKKYIATIVDKTGLPASTKLSDLTDAQLEEVVKVITLVEGWAEGKTYTCADEVAAEEFRTLLGCPDVIMPPPNDATDLPKPPARNAAGTAKPPGSK